MSAINSLNPVLVCAGFRLVYPVFGEVSPPDLLTQLPFVFNLTVLIDITPV
ncbi:hypothetical protein FOZG_16869 [Fusarium oxysporum Fo47]|uniref:Uncharacterized protein n=1 Tax=Fusarium oxysporum Fo47 TaxID=660027 RepID=W9JBR5_FUSOX|nr:hypothetical protein FOZG_16869 [Fusarium oxysporum Fo47]